MKVHELLQQLPDGSLRVYPHAQPHTGGNAPAGTERTYLEFDGTPAAFRFLSELFAEIAQHADKHGKAAGNQSVLLDPKDAQAIRLDGYDAISLSCRKRPPSSGKINL